VRIPLQLCDEGLDAVVVDAAALAEVACGFGPLDTESDTRGDVVNVLLDMGRDVVLLGGDIMAAGGMLPDMVLSEHETLDLANRGVKLNPLISTLLSVRTSDRPEGGQEIAYLLVDRVADTGRRDSG
jgi:hypothetical protein